MPGPFLRRIRRVFFQNLWPNQKQKTPNRILYALAGQSKDIFFASQNSNDSILLFSQKYNRPKKLIFCFSALWRFFLGFFLYLYFLLFDGFQHSLYNSIKYDKIKGIIKIMRPHRFIGNFDLSKKELSISNADFVNQARNVLRLKTGDELILCDGKMNEAVAKILLLAKDKAELEILEIIKNKNESENHVNLYCSILKKKILNWRSKKRWKSA